ncbi:uncharacterized protein LOC133818826 isoform X2 [Humulus lupulus]|uniref:uncharacterized protein LOC133818826 isoform X2 n=1 Tax=Humulus lupulus TaxID=3486 RepID=UPI002B40916D|nr:uncharacterized protein LOC133818826 isoform X2 [Humulus lupulus]
MSMEEGPSSPGTSAVELRDCMEELLKFTLESPIDLGFSPSLLLRSHPQITQTPDPFYKRLASVLCECIDSGGLGDLKNKEEWNELVQEKGFELLNILKTVDFELHVQEPFFTQLRVGLKTVEGRCAVGDYNRLRSKMQFDLLQLSSSGSILHESRTINVRRYASFYEMLEAESLAKVLPGVKTIQEGVQVYRKFYSEEQEQQNGVLAIHVTKPASQLYIPLAQILSKELVLEMCWKVGIRLVRGIQKFRRC